MGLQHEQTQRTRRMGAGQVLGQPNSWGIPTAFTAYLCRRLLDEDDDQGSPSSADVATKASTDGAAASGEPYANARAWRGLPSLRLYLVGYDPRQPQALGEALAAQGASVLSYVPDDTWLVAATPQAIRRVVKDTGSEAVGRMGGVQGASAPVLKRRCAPA